MKFTRNKSYYGREVWQFNLPAGHTCPGAYECFTVAHRKSGKLFRAKREGFTCYAAVNERFPAVRSSRWRNLEELQEAKTTKGMALLIRESIPKGATHVRIHQSGDFYSQEYFDAWLMVIEARQDITFWAFTKSISYVASRVHALPKNFHLVASMGGKQDELAKTLGMRSATVFKSRKEAEDSGLPIDFDDRLVYETEQSFALVDNFAKE